MKLWRLGVGLVLGFLLLGLAQQSVPFPVAYKQNLVRYAVVDRVDGKSRDLYASEQALTALRNNEEFPVGAYLAIDVHSAKALGQDPKTKAFIYAKEANGHLKRSHDEPILHLMFKSSMGFGTKTWAFGGYDPFTQKPLNLELPGDCLSCHQAALATDMIQTFDLLQKFAQTGQVQYAYCRYPGRQPC